MLTATDNSGLWLVFPTIMVYTMGNEIVTAMASGGRAVKSE